MTEAAATSAFAVLRGARLFHGVASERLSELASAAHTARFREGELLWRAGSEAHDFTVLARGIVQIERRVTEREPAILGIFGPRESIGDAAALAGTPYPADAVALSAQVVVVRIGREHVRAAMERDPAVASAVQQALLDHTSALTAKIDVVSAGSVAARLATLLVQLADRFGDEDDAGAVVIPVALSRTALARLVSARVETVIRALGSFSKAALVRTDARGLTLLDVAALTAIARAG